MFIALECLECSLLRNFHCSEMFGMIIALECVECSLLWNVWNVHCSVYLSRNMEMNKITRQLCTYIRIRNWLIASINNQTRSTNII